MAFLILTTTIWLLFISDCVVTSLIYQHTVFQRQLNPGILQRTPPVFSSRVSTFQECINKCHNQPSCESLVFDIVTLKCSLNEGKTVEEEITINQIYHQVLNKTVHRDIIAYVKNLCEENNPGYIYNESVSVCYRIDSNPRLFMEAELFCGESGGHLLRIDTERKQKFVEDLDLQSLNSISKYRIDGKKINDIWRFSNEKLVKQFYWYPGEPVGGGTSIGLRVGHNGKWDDIGSSKLHGCICEKDIKIV
eukprot:XP_011415999.1 PREDICTED: uncharacterized protein LOC105319959 [Crassostrea gigas]